MALQPKTSAHDQVCYAKDCSALAEFRCARCDKPCCAQHARQVRLERREESDETVAGGVQLMRVPSQVRTYVFCLRCTS
jgi:hypothetical protein